jgi:PAP2 superfamily
MSIVAADSTSLERRRTLAASGFVAILLLSILWPSPVVSVNSLVLHQNLAVDELSFLGREAPSWDVIYWLIAGLYTLALLQPAVRKGSFSLMGAREILAQTPSLVRNRLRSLRAWKVVVSLVAAAALVAIVWLVFDGPVTRWAERVQTDDLQSVIRLANRAGGGMNPAMIGLFFLFAGVSCHLDRWIRYAVAMAVAGLGCGIGVQVMKVLVGRSRPELWLGPLQHARTAATSFPSGHTVGAFALAGVLMFGSRSRPLQVISALVAICVGLARIFAFRHWASDVAASAILGLAAAWICTTALIEEART